MVSGAPFKPGDKVLCEEWITGVMQEGEVVDVLVYPSSPNTAWIVFVSHGEYEYAYAHNEVTLVSPEKGTVVYVDFKRKKKIKNPYNTKCDVVKCGCEQNPSPNGDKS